MCGLFTLGKMGCLPELTASTADHPQSVSDGCETSEFLAKECSQHQGDRRERDEELSDTANERVSDRRLQEMPRNQVTFDPDDCRDE